MKTVKVSGEVRTALGKREAARTRKEGKIPCVLYDTNQVIHFSAKINEVKNLIYTPEFRLANIEVEGKEYTCILKEYQMHPVTDAITHIDFLNLVEDQPIKIEVPVKFVGSSPGVKVGGKLQQMLRRVKLKTTPKHIVDSVELDISKLEMGQSIRVRDIKTIEGIEIMNNPGVPVAIVEVPRALRSAQASGEDGEDGEGADVAAVEA